MSHLNRNRPRILLIADVPNWIFHRHTKTFKHYLGHEFEFDLLFYEDEFDESNYDLIYPLEYNLVPPEKILTPKKYVTGIRSFQVLWKDDTDLVNIISLLQNKFQQVHTISKSLVNYFKPHLPKIYYVTHGVDTKLFAATTLPNASDKRLRLGWAGNRRQLKKGFEEFIKPLDNLEGVDLYFCGYVDENLSMKEMVGFYNSIDAYICASESEGNTNSLLEAASMERAIITTNNGAVLEYLKNEESALIVNRDTESFINAVITLRDNPEIRLKLGKAARQSILNGWDWEVKARDYSKFFSDALENAS